MCKGILLPKLGLFLHDFGIILQAIQMYCQMPHFSAQGNT
jgi:hypothetical protein